MTLHDHKVSVERAARERKHQQEVAAAFGSFIAELAPWDWFLNPITFRDPRMCPDCRISSSDLEVLAKHIESAHQKAFDPYSLRLSSMGAPPRDLALRRLRAWFSDLEEIAGKRIGWMIAEEFGRLGGRWHCHGLVTGVGHLRREDAWKKMFDRFGRTRIEPFDSERGGAFYAAKYAAKQLGQIHFEGVLQGIDLSAPHQEFCNPRDLRRIQYPPITDKFFLSSKPFKQSLRRLHR